MPPQVADSVIKGNRRNVGVKFMIIAAVHVISLILPAAPTVTRISHRFYSVVESEQENSINHTSNDCSASLLVMHKIKAASKLISKTVHVCKPAT